MDGTVVAYVARPGQTLNASQQAPVILRVANMASLALVAQVSEADVIHLRPGGPARFTLLGQTDREFSARVRQILPSPSFVNGVVFYDVLVDVPRGESVFRIGMTASVLFVLARHECMVRIPRFALPADLRPPRTVPVRIALRGGNIREIAVPVLAANDTEAGVSCAEAERLGLPEGAEIVIPARASAPGRR
jgi:macrolide-specific efflux system membrane fusion protein